MKIRLKPGSVRGAFEYAVDGLYFGMMLASIMYLLALAFTELSIKKAVGMLFVMPTFLFTLFFLAGMVIFSLERTDKSDLGGEYKRDYKIVATAIYATAIALSFFLAD